VRLTVLFAVVTVLIAGCSRHDQDYLCFADPSTATQRVCYLAVEDDDRDAVVRGAVKMLGENIDEPGSLVKVHGEMAVRYTKEHFRKSLKRHFEGIGPANIAFTLTHGPYTAVLLNEHSTLYYDHDAAAFIFGFEPPIVFEGAAHFYGRGIEPTTERLGQQLSNCSLVRDGIVFESEEKPSLYYSDAKPFCEYSGYYFTRSEDGIAVRKADQLSLGYSVVHAAGFVAFLRWMKEEP